jgi:DNA polymerase III delta subunit
MVSGRAATTPESTARALREGGTAPPFVLAAGPSDYWRDEIVRAYRDGAASGGADFLRLEGDELDAEGLANALESLSLFASARRIWIREGGKIEKACEERLLAWADAPVDGLSILLTSAREPAELKFLGSLAAKVGVVACDERPGDARREVERLARDEGLRLPPGLAEAIGGRAHSLLALREEIAKLRLHADAEGRLPAASLDVLALGRAAASADRWAAAVLRRDAGAARREAAALAAEGSSAGNALWAVASLALAALEPQAYGYRARSAPSGPPLRPAAARAALDAVYRADRGMKRGEIRDEEVIDVLEFALQGGSGGTSVRTT